MARFEELRLHLDKVFRSYTDIGNASNIRHSERGKTLIDDDPILIEHLFYSVWSLIRAVLEREAAGATNRTT